jgi:hypothetical protein
MFKKGKDLIFLFGVLVIFIAFGMFLYNNPIVEGVYFIGSSGHSGFGSHGFGADGHGFGGRRGRVNKGEKYIYGIFPKINPL